MRCLINVNAYKRKKLSNLFKNALYTRGNVTVSYRTIIIWNNSEFNFFLFEKLIYVSTILGQCRHELIFLGTNVLNNFKLVGVLL